MIIEKKTVTKTAHHPTTGGIVSDIIKQGEIIKTTSSDILNYIHDMKKHIYPEMILFEKDIAQNVYISKNKFKNYELHSHDFYELEFFIEGNGVCEINGKEYSFQEGDISFSTPLDIHGYKSNCSVKTLTVHFRLANMSPVFYRITGIKSGLIKSTEEIKNAFSILISSHSMDAFSNLLCEKVLEAILLLLLQNFRPAQHNVLMKEIYSAVEYINLNFKKDINLKTVSEYIGYSQEHFSRQFKKYTGTGFFDYLTELRLTYAKHLLNKREMTITQICYESGFGCMQSFRRAFKKKYGASPKMFQNQKMFPIHQEM